MSADKSTSWSYAEDLPAEDEVLLRARERSFELGVTPIGRGVGAVLTVLAAASKAQTAVEIGTGAARASFPERVEVMYFDAVYGECTI